MSITGLPVHHRALIWYGSDHIFCVFSAYYTRLQGFGDPADSLILELVYHYSTMTLQHSMPQNEVRVPTGCSLELICLMYSQILFLTDNVEDSRRAIVSNAPVWSLFYWVCLY
jgi:hypothetical protein